MSTPATTPILYDNTSEFVYNNTLVKVQSNQASLLAPFSVANPTILSTFKMQASSITAFVETAAYSGGDAIQYTLFINSIDYYWNGSAWVVSDGSYSQSNTAAVINTNCGHASLATILTVTGSFVQVKAFLHSASGTTTPFLTEVAVSYGFIAIRPVNPAQCVVYCYLEDILGAIIGSVQEAQFSVQQKDPFIYGSFVIAPFVKSTSFDVNGYAQLVLDETTTPGYSVLFSISYIEGKTRKQINCIPCQIPNAGAIALTGITTFENRSAPVSPISPTPVNSALIQVENQVNIDNNATNTVIPSLSFSPVAFSMIRLEYTLRRKDTGEYFREDGYIVLDWNEVSNVWRLAFGALSGSSGPISGVDFSVATGASPNFYPTVSYSSDNMTGGGTYVGTMRYKVVSTFAKET